MREVQSSLSIRTFATGITGDAIRLVDSKELSDRRG
jgi:hypothetical protein